MATENTTDANSIEARLARIEAVLGFSAPPPPDPAARQAEMKAADDAAKAELDANDGEALSEKSSPARHTGPRRS